MESAATQDHEGFRPPEIWSRSVPCVFEGVVERFPDRIAVVCGDDRATYGELNQRANAVAAALLDAGLSPEDPVAVAVPKSAAQIASLLGVLKAGGAYVPVVTNQPAERLTRIVRDAGCRYALASPGYADAALEGVATRIDPRSLPASSRSNPVLSIKPGHLAYIMYTSGSTGDPKGVMVEHAGVVRLVHGQDYMPFGPDLNFLYGGPLSFDLSTIEIFTPLLHGAKLLISEDQVLAPETVRRFAEEEGLRGVCISFSLFRALFEADAGAFERVPVIGVCGEPADARFIRQAQDRLPDAAFYNAYGPTECTALSTTHRIPRPCPVDPAVVPIGVPLRGMTARIVDEQGRSVPPGAKGELVIAGVGVGRGYLNDAALTARRFISDPARPAERAYRSGDLAHLLPDGVIAYAGRSDDQVKIRGQRIELGEIDAAMAADPFIKAGASVVVGTGADARVGVCVVPRNPLAFNAAALVDRLAERLTPAMLPSVVVPVESIPINRNGKADRAAVRALIVQWGIPDGDTLPAPIVSPHREPRGGNEETLLGISEPIVGRPCDLDRSWFQNGGDSLRAMILRIRLRERAGMEVSVPSILGAADLGALAAMLTPAPPTFGTSVEHDIRPGPVPLSPAQRRLWTVQQMDPSSGAYNVAYRFAFKALPDRAAFESAWRDLHARHPALRTGFEAHGDGEPRGVLAASVAPSVEWDVRLEDAVVLRNRVAEPFDLTRPPLTRMLMSTQGDGGGGGGVLVMHHIITDAWSMDIMFRDLEALYRRHRDGLPTDLPEPLPGAPAHSALLSEISRTEATRSRAEGAAGSFRERPPTYARCSSESGESTRAEYTAVAIDARLRGLIEQAAAESGVSTHAVLLACFSQWAAELCAVEEPAVGLAFSNRDDGPFADAVGFFVETVPVRVRVSGIPFMDLVKSAHAAVEDGHARRSVPFDLLARLAGSPGVPGRTPITEMFLNVIDRAPLADAHADDREIRPDSIEIDHGLARFDLLCTLYRDRTGWRLTVAARSGRWHGRDAVPSADEFIARLASALEGRPHLPEGVMPAPSAGVVPAADRPGPGASDPLTESIAWDIVSVFRSVLGRADIGPDDDFFRAGGDSLRALRAFGMIRRLHPTALTTAAMFGHPTARALAVRIHANESAPSRQPFMWFSEPCRPRTALVFPGVTGDALSMRAMLGALGGDWSVRAAMYPGTLGDREPLDALPALVGHFMPTLEADGRAGREVLVGYSFGGIVAYELAVRLQEAGRAPGWLVLIDTALMKRFPVREGSLPLSVHLERFRGHDWAGRRRHIARVGAGLWRRLRGIGHREERYDRLPEIRRLSSAHLRAIRDYRPSAPYEGRTLIIRATGFDGAQQSGDRTNGWGPFLTHPPVIVDLPTDHVGLMKSAAAADVARAIRETVGPS